MMFLLEIYKCKINNLRAENRLIPLPLWSMDNKYGRNTRCRKFTADNKNKRQVRQNSSTKNMFIKIPSIVSKLSMIMTLEKGDIISTGTPEGVALNNPDTPFLKDGDKIDMENRKTRKNSKRCQVY